jgi:hypothetical protein
MTAPKQSKITAKARERMRKTPASEQLRQAKAALRKPDNPERTEPVQKGMLQ